MRSEDMERIRAHMMGCMGDSAHDAQHVLRVTRSALQIARAYPQADMDVLTAAALLHDIGRAEEFRSGENHAKVGARLAEEYLLSIGWAADKAAHVAECVRTHRFRANSPPVTIEAQILFDADKLDVVGAIGIARTLLYSGKVDQPLYALGEDGAVDEMVKKSFVGEYNRKLKLLYERFCTPEAAQMAVSRREAAERFYESLMREIALGREEER